MSVDIDRLERLKLDLDTRLVDLWADAGGVDKWDLEMVAEYMRAAYGAGYFAALTEPVPGTLCRENGYAVPRRRA